MASSAPVGIPFVLPIGGTPDAMSLSIDGMLASPGGGFIVTGIDVTTTADDGGWGITATGDFSASPTMTVDIMVSSDPKRAYSGRIGSEDQCLSENLTTVRFVVPPLAIGGPYDILFTAITGGFTSTLSAAITVIHRDFVSNLYSLRSHLPPPRDVGPYSITEEDWGG